MSYATAFQLSIIFAIRTCGRPGRAELDFIARLAALVPRPRSHLIRFHGLFAPNARHRRLVVPGPAPGPVSEGADQGATPTRAQMTWAQRLRRVFDIDLRFCPHCGAELRVLAVITNPQVIATILAHRARHGSRDPPAASQPVVQPPP